MNTTATMTSNALSVNETNPDGCHPVDTCHSHVHGEGCGHEAVPHSDHVDSYIVNGQRRTRKNGKQDLLCLVVTVGGERLNTQN